MRIIITHQLTSMNYHKSFLIHADRISAKKCRTEINKNYIADQIMRLYYKIIKNIKKIFNAEHFVSLVQRKKLTHLIERTITRRLRMSHCSSQKLIISETASSLITDKNA